MALMNEPMPYSAARLRAVLRNSPAGEAPAGLYDVIRNERTVRLGQDHARDEARMVSLHEGFHAFLNASTTFGNAMTFAAALAEIEEPGFADWVEQMIGASVETHETYATVAALCAASRGRFDAALLAAYPDYHQFLERFTQAFGTGRPVLTALALSACARAAMQTSIFGQMLASTCSTWPSLKWPREQRPDWRLAQMLQPGPAAAALESIDRALAGLGEPLIQLSQPDLPPLQAIELLARAPIDAVEILNQVSFTAFANALGASGAAVPGYDDQRNGLLELVDRIKAYAGDRLRMTFTVPETLEDDVTAVMANYRHEQLELREGRDAAVFVDVQQHSARFVEPFVGKSEHADYVQLIAMPKAKADALYELIDSRNDMDAFPGEVLTGLRRRYVPADGPPVVQFLLIRLPLLAEMLAHAAPVRPVTLLSTAALDIPSWAAEWERHGARLAPRWLVHVDTDPFELVDQLAASDAPLQMAFVRFCASPDNPASLIEILCLVSAARPNQAFVLPCSAPVREAVAAYAQRKTLNVDLAADFLQDWRSLLSPAISHLIREESRFGNRFWEN